MRFPDPPPGSSICVRRSSEAIELSSGEPGGSPPAPEGRLVQPVGFAAEWFMRLWTGAFVLVCLWGVFVLALGVFFALSGSSIKIGGEPVSAPVGWAAFAFILLVSVCGAVLIWRARRGLSTFLGATGRMSEGGWGLSIRTGEWIVRRRRLLERAEEERFSPDHLIAIEASGDGTIAARFREPRAERDRVVELADFLSEGDARWLRVALAAAAGLAR